MGESVYQDYPWRSTSNHFHALTAEIFLQRTKVKQVRYVYNKFCKKYKNPHDVLEGRKKEYEKILSPLGLHWRIPLYRRFCEELVDRHKGKIPVNKKELMSLSAVGDYVASAFLSFHLNTPLPLIDTNTIRFVSRYFGINKNQESRRNKKFKYIMAELLPGRYSSRFNYCLLDFSMNICSTRPSCMDCKFRFKCQYYKNNSNEY